MGSSLLGLRVTSPGRLFIVSLLMSSLLFCWPAQQQPGAAAVSAAPPAAAPDSGGAALAFEPNAGQTDPVVRYLARAPGAALFFAAGEVVLALRSPAGLARHEAAPGSAETVVRVHFEGANPAPEVAGVDRLPGVVNYLRGSDPAGWQTDLPTYAGIEYRELYPGVALRYQGSAGSLKGTYAVAPAADPGRIRWRYDGAAAVRLVEGSGDLEISLPGTGQAGLVETAPVAWQMIDGERAPVRAAYALAGDGTIGLALGPYDRDLTLMIDPQVMFSTYLGGNGTDEGKAIAVDAEGNTYVAGVTASTAFPTASPLQPGPGGMTDAFVLKLNPAGNAYLFSTYLGGGKDDAANGIAVDRSGNVVVAGVTHSTNFPLVSARQDTLLNINGEAFLAKLSPTGAALIFSTYLGGVGGAEARGVATDFDGNVYVTGSAGSGFPVFAPYQGATLGDDAFVAKLNPAGTRFIYSTYLGGSSLDNAYGIAVDWAGKAFIAGETFSPNFPVANAYQPACKPLPGYTNCSADAFVAELSADGSSLVYSTYLGSSAADVAYAIAVDDQDGFAVTGMTKGTDFPLVHPWQLHYGGNPADAFVTKFDAAGQPVFSTYLGGSGYDPGTKAGIAVDPEGRIAVTGSTSSADFPTHDPIKGTLSPGQTNAFVTQFTPDGQMTFGTYWGTNTAPTNGTGVAADSAGNVYVAGVTRALDFWVTNPVQRTFGGPVSDAFATKIHVAPALALEFSPAQLVFGQYRGGETGGPLNVVVHNAGVSAGSIDHVALAGANPLDFAITTDTCTGTTLTGDLDCEIAVTFSPRASGMRYARVEVSGSNFPGTRSIQLRGKGAPMAELSPGPLEFAITEKNTTSPPLIETLRNTGLELMNLGPVVISGANADDFTIVDDKCSNIIYLHPNGTCKVTLQFTPHADGFRYAYIDFTSAVFDAPVRAALGGMGGPKPSITIDGAEWGMCAGQTVTVRGTNFPRPGTGSQGQYEIRFDGTLRASGATGADGRFVAQFAMPPLAGTSHVVSASDPAVPAAYTTVPVRTPGTDLPVILIPGVSASYIDTNSAFVYTAPPDPELAWPIMDLGQYLPSVNPVLGGEHIWLDWVGFGAAVLKNYRFFDMLGLKADGVSPQPDMFGVVPDLRVGSILWDIRITLAYADFFQGLKTYLLETGRYNDTPGAGRNLYYFPYDWRKDIRLTGPALNDMVNQALVTSGKDRVVILAHSMGGLVARNYMLQYGASKVDQLITMATPFQGSPLVGKVLEVGDDWGIGAHFPGTDLGIGMHPKEMKKLAQNFPSSYELLMSRQYFTADPTDPAFDPRYLVIQSRKDGQVTSHPLDYAETIAYMNDNHNATLNQSAERFRDSGVGDLSLLAGQLFHQRIMGWGEPTIGRTIITPRTECATYPLVGVICKSLFEYGIPVLDLDGDGTVSLQSGRGANAPNDSRVYYVPGKHTEVPGTELTKMLVNQMLLGQRCSRTNPPWPLNASGQEASAAPEDGALAADPAGVVTGVEIMTAGHAVLTVTDSQGRQTGAEEGIPYGGKDDIPGSAYEQSIGGDFVALTQDGDYTLTLRGIATDGVLGLRIVTLQEGSMTETRLFESIPVTTTTAATVTLSLPGPVVAPQLDYTFDAQSPVQHAALLPVLTGAAAQDLIPPVTQISVGADRKVTLTATDTGGSGLRQILYSTDGGAHYQVYTTPFPFAPCVTAVAQDLAGNAEYPPAALPCQHVDLPLLKR